MKRVTITDPSGLKIWNQVEVDEARFSKLATEFPGSTIDAVDITAEKDAEKAASNARRAILRGVDSITTIAQARAVLKALIQHQHVDTTDEA